MYGNLNVGRDFDLANEKEKKGSNTVERVREMALPLCEQLGLFLWDVRFEKEGATWYLRVFIDKDGGVGIEDCEAFARPFDTMLDEADPISVSYVFECGSPGLGRDLKRPEHFLCCIGDEIRIRTIRPDENGEREFSGVLTAYDNKEFDVDIDGASRHFVLQECSFVKLFDDKDLF